jgi:hypothetical protein
VKVVKDHERKREGALWKQNSVWDELLTVAERLRHASFMTPEAFLHDRRDLALKPPHGGRGLLHGAAQPDGEQRHERRHRHRHERKAPVEGEHHSELASRFTEDRFAISRDGRWLAFTSNQSGRDEVYVRPMSGGGDQVQVSAAGGLEPVWGQGPASCSIAAAKPRVCRC